MKKGYNPGDEKVKANLQKKSKSPLKKGYKKPTKDSAAEAKAEK